MGVIEMLLDYNGGNFEYNKKTVLSNIKNLNSSLNALCNVYDDDIVHYIPDTTQCLNGCIVTIKDLFCYKDHPVQAASKILNGFVSSYSSTAVQRLVDNGALIVGHTNCDEFGMGASNEHSVYGPVHNYLDVRKTPGGSSGGAAVSVQAGMCHLALGTDTGGSVRQPAAFCGVIGFKPSYGVISRCGVIAHSSSFDTVGILAKKISYIQDSFKILCGFDGYDLSMSRDYTYTRQQNKDNFKVAYLKDTLDIPVLQTDVKTAIEMFLEKLRYKKCSVESVKCDLLKYAVAVYYTLTTAEASSNLARYDGVRYGYKPSQYDNYEELITKTRTEGFGNEVQRRLLCGNYVFDTRDINHYYDTALHIRQAFKDYFFELFKDYDFIVLPTTTTTAFKINDNDRDKTQIFWDDVFTFIASIAQLPAISIPCGVDGSNMPIGVQIIANKYHDADILVFCDNIL